jgi:adenosine deaminase
MGRIGRTKIVALLLAGFVVALGAQAPVNNEAATARKFAAIRSNPLALEAFLREMPKGGDLHNHGSGAIYAESYFRWAVEDGSCMIVATFTFAAAPCDASAGRPAASAVMADAALYNQAIDALSIRNWPPGLNGHDHFFAAFGKFSAVSAAHGGDIVAELSSRAAAEHVSYLEVMVTPYAGAAGRGAGWTPDFAQMRAKLLPGENDILASSKQRLDAFEARRNETQKCGKPAADPGCAVVVRYVAQVARATPPEEVFAQIMAGFDVAAHDPRVVGINLVQPEDAPIAVRDFTLQMKMIEYLRPFYPGVHVSLHAGEIVDSLVPPDVLRFHISESVRIAHAERIGHGVAVMNEDHPYELLREMARKKVLVEINLTSNDSILGVKGNRHPLRTYLQYGVPVAISTDDYGVARSSHTLEFLKAVQEHNLDYLTVKRMVRNSIAYAFADAGTKAQLTRDLEAAFKDFETRQ